MGGKDLAAELPDAVSLGFLLRLVDLRNLLAPGSAPNHLHNQRLAVAHVGAEEVCTADEHGAGCRAVLQVVRLRLLQKCSVALRSRDSAHQHHHKQSPAPADATPGAHQHKEPHAMLEPDCFLVS